MTKARVFKLTCPKPMSRLLLLTKKEVVDKILDGVAELLNKR